MPNALMRGARWLMSKALPAPMARQVYSDAFSDIWQAERTPDAGDLIGAFQELVFACASINASTFASIPLRLFFTQGAGETKARCRTKAISRKAAMRFRAEKRLDSAEDVQEVLAHPLLDLLATVNPEIDTFTLMELTALYQEITGTAYWWLKPGMMGLPEEIWPLQSQDVREVRNAQKEVSGYAYGSNLDGVVYPKEEVVVWRYPSLTDPYHKGYSWVQAAWATVQLMRKQSAYQQTIFDNQGRPDAIISPKDEYGWDESMRKRFEREFNAKFRGKGGSRVWAADSAVQMTPMSWPPKDMNKLALYEQMREIVANVSGVPLTKLTRQDANKAGAETGDDAYIKDTILPKCRRFEQGFTQKICSRYDPRIFVAFDNPVPEDRAYELLERETNLRTGFWSLDEARTAAGEETIGGPEGETRFVPVAVQPMDAAINPPEPAPNPFSQFAPGQKKPKPDEEEEEDEEDMPEPEKRLALGEVFVAYAVGDIDRKGAVSALGILGVQMTKGLALTNWPAVNAPHEHAHEKARPQDRKKPLPTGRDLKAVLAEEFRLQMREVLNGLQQKGWVPPEPYFSSINPKKWTERLAKKVEPLVRVYYDEGAKEFAARALLTDKLDDIWSLTNPRVTEAIDKAVFRFCDETNATTALQLDTALDELRNELTAGIMGPENTIAELTRRVKAVYENAEEYRAERIAITESSRAVHQGERIAAEESGVVKGYEWLLSSDACPICQGIKAANPQGIELHGHFAIQGTGPYAVVDAPPAHPNCQCTLTEIIDWEKLNG